MYAVLLKTFSVTIEAALHHVGIRIYRALEAYEPIKTLNRETIFLQDHQEYQKDDSKYVTIH